MKNSPIKVILLELLSVVIGIFGIATIYSAFRFDTKLHIKAVLIVVGLLITILTILLLIKNDIKYGYYECSICKEKFIPTKKDVLSASRFHYFENTREIKCPKCNKKTSCLKKY